MTGLGEAGPGAVGSRNWLLVSCAWPSSPPRRRGPGTAEIAGVSLLGGSLHPAPPLLSGLPGLGARWKGAEPERGPGSRVPDGRTGAAPLESRLLPPSPQRGLCRESAGLKNGLTGVASFSCLVNAVRVTPEPPVPAAVRVYLGGAGPAAPTRWVPAQGGQFGARSTHRVTSWHCSWSCLQDC